MTIKDQSKWPIPNWPAFILDHLPNGLITVDNEFKINYFNPEAEKITGYTAEETFGRFCGDILHGGNCASECPLRTVLDFAPQDSFILDTTLVTKDGRIVPIRLRTSALYDDQGRLLGAVEAFADISSIKRLEEEKAHTLSLFAHDMKGPLISAAGFIGRLMDGKAGEMTEKQREYLNVVQEEVHHVQTLILDFLDVARLSESGVKNLVTEPIDLAVLLAELTQNYQQDALEAGLELELTAGSDIPTVQADIHRLKRIFTNLITNAINYAGRGRVRIVIRENRGGNVVVDVLDEGPGLSESDREHLFKPFHRGEAARGKEGTGLGLAAVKSIVEAHDGTIEAANRPEGGARFTVTLPSGDHTN